MKKYIWILMITINLFAIEYSAKEEYILDSSLVIDEDIYIRGSIIKLNGKKLIVNGNLILEKGTLKIDRGELVVNGNFLIDKEDGSLGYFYMIHESDRVLVDGDFVINSFYSHENLLSAGTLEVKGDFIQKVSNSTSNFATNSSHKTILSGSNQKVYFETPQKSFFTNLKITNSNEVDFNSTIGVKGSLISTTNSLYNLSFATEYKLNSDFKTSGDFKINQNFHLNGNKLIVNGDLILETGDLNISGGTLIVKDDFLIDGVDTNESYSHLIMQNEGDKILVDGNFLMNSFYSHENFLTNGILEIKGNFTQKFVNSYHSFNTIENHKVILSGTSEQNVSFDTPPRSLFNKLEVCNSSINFLNVNTNELLLLNTLTIPNLNYGSFNKIDNCSYITYEDIIKETTIDTPLSATTIENSDGSKTIELNPITLENGQISISKLEISSDGDINSSIEVNGIKTLLKAPSGIDVEIDEKGNIRQNLARDNIKTEVVANSSGEVESSIEIDGVNLEFKVPAGSSTNISESGEVKARNSFENGGEELKTVAKVDLNGTLSANALIDTNSSFRATKVSKLKITYSSRREFSNVKLDVILGDNLRTTKLSSSKFKVTFSARKSFSFKTSSLREISNEIVITPTESAIFEEYQYFDGRREIKLISGNATIYIDENPQIMPLNQIYTLSSNFEEFNEPFVDNKLSLNKGWNLISIPIKGEFERDKFTNTTTLTYQNGEWKSSGKVNSEIGIWVKVDNEVNIEFSGETYTPNFNLNEGWHLIGSGEYLEDIKESYNLKECWKFENNKWIKNPDYIYQGDGFWVKR